MGRPNGFRRTKAGRYAQAEELFNQTLEIDRRVLGPDHPETLRCMYDLAEAYHQQGKYAQAETLFNQTLEIRRRVLGPHQRRYRAGTKVTSRATEVITQDTTQWSRF
jgi:tetratricopeptide (TPR) repeat protein